MKIVTEEAWEAAGKEGDKLVRTLLGRRALKMIRGQEDSQLAIAFGLGALVATGEFLVEVTNPDARVAIERWALGHLRGAIRGSVFPIHDDGRPMLGLYDG